ncbi:MAG: SRPBCC domain-containing protein [Gemmatimonadetes bacterium]|nr:SRPBCC domain-containing protein [Gemmatimonadota bacterium]
MPLTSVVSDPQALTITIVADYTASLERLWEAYADPRQIERFWGPVEYPATFTQHDMAVGGYSHYYMTGPTGDRHDGWWHFLKIEPYRLIEIEDGFSHEDGSRNDGLPYMRMVFNFEATPTGSRFTSVTYFPSLDAMEQLVQMGMMEGMRSAMSQIDGVLADLATFAATRATDAQLLSDTQVRVSRVIRGSVEQVWRAHHEPALMKRWLLGPDGWTMPVCEVATAVGDRYRYEWANADQSQRFGFEGELLESAPPYRAVTTEQMIGTPGPATRNELTLSTVPGGTLMALVITYPSKDVRDMILGTGMTAGMEASYQRLEREVLAAA